MTGSAKCVNTVFVILLLTMDSSFSLVAYDCGGETINKTTISLIETPDCSRVYETPDTNEVRIVLTQTSDQEEINVYRCFVKASHIIKRCGRFLGDHQLVGHYTKILEPGHDACKLLIEDNIYRVPFAPSITLEFPGPGKHFKSFVSHGSPSQDGGCDGGGDLIVDGQKWDRSVRYTSLELEYIIEKATVDYEAKTLIFPNGIRCDLTREHCEHGDYGSLYWKVPSPKCESKVGNQALIYKGVAELITTSAGKNNVSFVQIKHDGYDFQIKLEPRNTYICGFKSFYTEHPRLFVTIVNEFSAPFPEIKGIAPREVNMMNYINSKIVYSLRHTKHQVDNLFRLFEKERCLTQNRITSNLMSLAIISPTNFAYSYFNEPGYTAVIRGEVVHVAKCMPVFVVPKQNTGSTCYNELAVEYKNKTVFVTPRSRIIVPNGQVVSCSSEVGPMYKLAGRWITQTNVGLIPSRSPSIIEVEPIEYEFEPLDNLVNGGLYSPEVILEYQKILTSPMEESIIKSRIVSAINEGHALPDGVDFSKGFTMNTVESLSGSIMEKVDGVLGGFYFLTKPVTVVMIFYFVIGKIIALINYIIRLHYLKKDRSLFKSMMVGMLGSLSHIFLTRPQGNSVGRQERDDYEGGELLQFSNQRIMEMRGERQPVTSS